MATISDVSIIDSNTAKAKPVESGLERTICSPAMCGSKNLTVYRRRLSPAGSSRSTQATTTTSFTSCKASRAAAFVSRASPTPPRTARACCSHRANRLDSKRRVDLELLHMITPKPPSAVEAGLPGGPGLFLQPEDAAHAERCERRARAAILRRVERQAARRHRPTPTNAIQAGEMHYKEGGASPYHMHKGTDANPDGAAHAYMTFKGRGKVDVGDTSQEIEPGTLVYFPPGVPHRLNAHGGTLDYFEIQAWRSFKTTILSKEAATGLKWYYDREGKDAPLVEWNQS